MNGLDLANKALDLWNNVHGSESLDQQCQRFTGYYEQWAYQGNENIVTYASAIIAANASRIEGTNINDVPVGANLFWDIGTYGHVGRAIGNDGRTIVSYATSKGDLIQQLRNGVRIGHADTYPASFIGWSRANGTNSPISIDAWSPGGGSTPGKIGNTNNSPVYRDGSNFEFWVPDGNLQLRIQKALAARGRYDGPQDGAWGTNTVKGIQTTVKNVGYDGPIDGDAGQQTSYYVQVYAQKFGDYAGPVDSFLGQNSWEGFALGLERP